mmetsp:Transcript_20113/g.9324  ORF Transcript_20113/g.9324 Transcript_20113/m.9324 type:complete len:80 (+) Transcript_20113:591-830(+)
MYYESGIIDADCSGAALDHGIGCVAYGADGGIPFWKVRNSWGSNWGENGYARILRTDSTTDYGLCGIAEAASYPTGFRY